MCTAATYKTKDFYFGRNLDYDFSYGEEITVVPRKYLFEFTNGEKTDSHYAMIGMAHIADGYPLFYDAFNEKGLCMAGLNFVGNAHYAKPSDGCDNVATFELIPRVLSECADIGEAQQLIERINITDVAFSDALPPSSLHWIIADKNGAITVEAVEDGVRIYQNPVGVLANNPTFDVQMQRLNDYMHLSPRDPENLFSKALPLHTYSRGMGTMGLPGDLSSASRFVRAAFVKMNSVSGDSNSESISQFFHILGSVDQQRGCCAVGDKFEYTIYTSCCNADKGIYYYTTYENHQISAVDMNREDLDGTELVTYPLMSGEQVRFQN